MFENKPKSVLIVGAGLSGLSAAEEILKASPNTEVTILEAQDHVGGRTYSIELENAYFDLGAQWVGPPQKYAIDLSIRAKN